jgi:MFS family permease
LTGRPALSARLMTLLAARTVGTVGTEVFGLAMVWFLTGLTHSAGALGAFFAITELPYLLLLIPAGIWADRTDRRRLGALFLGLRVLVLTALALLLLTHRLPWMAVAGFVVLQESCVAVSGPALGAWTTGLVAPEALAPLSAWQQTGSQLATLIGPALGGLLIGLAGTPGAVAFGAVTGAVALAGVLLYRGSPVSRGSSQPPSPSRTFGQGWTFLREHPGMLYMVIFFSATNGLNDVIAVLVPLLARLLLHLTAWEFGALATCFGVGALGGAWLGVRVDERSRHRMSWVLGTMALFGGAIVSMGLARDAAWLGMAYVLGGLTFAVSEVVTSTMWQRMVPDAMRGRVMSTLSTLARSANPIGYLLAAWLGATLGIRDGLFIGGGAIVVLSLAMTGSQAIRLLDTPSSGLSGLPT